MRRATSSTVQSLPPSAPPRVIVLWCPDWPVTAAVQAAGLAPDAEVALIAQGVVFAASASARIEGVSRGIRLREAQSRCPDLIVMDYDPALDNRAFEPLIAAVEQFTPGVQLLRPGVCAVRVRGAAQYYGGERAAALTLLGRLGELGAGPSGARAGIADGIFTAEQAARGTTRRTSAAGVSAAGGAGGAGGTSTVAIVPTGESAQFLAPLDIGLMDDPALVTLLRRLGIRTLGDFAALPPDDVRTRFGQPGARLHALAAGRDSWPLSPRTPPTDFDVVVDFEPALDRVDQVAFGVRTAAEKFIDDLTAAKLVCTAIRVALHSDSGEASEREWLHPRSFTPADVVDRVRWQLQGSSVVDAGLSSGVTRVTISPEAVDAIGNHESGLWGSGPDERIHHGLSRVQSMLGHGAVLMPSVGGGRTLLDRQQLVAWGDRPVAGRSTAEPWPGQLPHPLPGTVFAARHAVHVLGQSGHPVAIDERGLINSAPASLTSGSQTLTLTAWAGPWPLDERWWAQTAGRSWRFQAVDHTGCAWLLVLDGGGWWAEARYD